MRDSLWNLKILVNIFKMVRVHIVAGGVLAFSLGTLLAVLNDGGFNATQTFLGYLVVFFGDLSTHYSNDYFDIEVDRHDEHRKFFGGSGILIEYPMLVPIAKYIAIFLMVLSVSIAIILVSFFDVPNKFLFLAIGANLLGWFYSAPPLRLNSTGFGEIAIAVGTGFVIPGAGYLIAKGQFDLVFVLFAIPFTMYGLMLSFSLEIPDMEIDAKGGKKNLVVRKGRRFISKAVLLISLLATIIFLSYTLNIASLTIIDLRIAALFSGFPLGAGIIGFLWTSDKKDVADFIGAVNITSLFLFNVLMNLYFFNLLF
ncbi:MAG: prenyltransferase [Candidatus Bathyarchaeota archaeon]|nr:prenyltransferase [Candidatus Bathyarchaeota archaeon]